MTTIRTVATHQVVASLFPRPVTERDERAMIAGRVIDGAVARCSHELRIGRRPTIGSLLERAGAEFDEAVADADLPEDAAERGRMLREVAGVLQAFRKSALPGLARPRTHLILINEEVGVYAQPDFWDGSRRFYEMKSYRPVPVPPDVALQLRFFQLAFPGFEAVLIGFDRRADPVSTATLVVPAPTAAEGEAALVAALRIGRASGTPKVLEYIAEPVTAYRVPEPGPSAESPPDPPSVPGGEGDARD